MTEPARRRRIAVIGGGLAGLVAARALLVAHPDLEVTLFEGSSVLGGKLRLGHVAGHAVDLGAESILNRRPEGVDLARALGLGDSVVHPAVSGAGIWTRGAVRPLPPTLMGVPGDVAAATRSGLLSRAGGIRASFESRLPSPDLSDDIGVGVLVARRLGREVRDRLVEPLLGGVYAGRADEISLQAALPQVVDGVRQHGSLLAAARAATHPRTDEAQPPVFAGLVGGVGRLAQQAAADIVSRGAQVRADAMVRELQRSPSGWRLVVGPTAAPERLEFDAVIIAVPATPAGRLLRDAVPAAARDLQQIDYASMAVVTVAFETRQVAARLVGTGFLVPPVDAKAIKAATYASQKWAWQAGDTTVIRCSIGRFREEAELQRDDSELIEAAVLDLREAVGLHAPLIDAAVTRWGGALPQYAVGHVERVGRILAAIAGAPGLEVCGAAYAGVGIPAVIATANAAATRVADALAATDTMGS
jgi:oxygen-dependent protoporphyrinogen oxidase